MLPTQASSFILIADGIKHGNKVFVTERSQISILFSQSLCQGRFSGTSREVA
jgi:hypothetical protein